MPKTPLKYAVLLLLLAFVAYNSVYFKKLDEHKASAVKGGTTFDAVTYARTFWTKKLLPATSRATDLGTLTTLLKTDKAKAFADHSHALGIGNIRYFLVKGEGKITDVTPDEVSVTLPSGELVKLATEYIFGNAARDASGLIQITEFDNTMDLNNVSSELNRIIRKQVVPPLKTSAKPGATVRFVGAIELNKDYLHLDNLEVIPIAVNVAP